MDTLSPNVVHALRSIRDARLGSHDQDYHLVRTLVRLKRRTAASREHPVPPSLKSSLALQANLRELLETVADGGYDAQEVSQALKDVCTSASAALKSFEETRPSPPGNGKRGRDDEPRQRKTLTTTTTTTDNPHASPTLLDDADTRPTKRVAKRSTIDDAQLLYNYLIPLPDDAGESSLSNNRRPSIRSLVKDAASSSSSSSSPSSPHGTSATASRPLATKIHLDSVSSTPVTLAGLWEAVIPLIPARGSMIPRRTNISHAIQVVDERDHRGSVECLEQVVSLLGDLCAPVRDAQVVAIKAKLAAVREVVSLTARETAGTAVMLEEAMKLTDQLVRDMEEDMQHFRLGVAAATTTEDDLQRTVKAEAQRRERDAIEELIQARKTSVTSEAIRWLGEHQTFDPTSGGATLTTSAVRTALLDTLFSDKPVFVPSSSSTDRLPQSSVRESAVDADPERSSAIASAALPPIFWLARTHLLWLQNRLQALVILATLATLVPGAVDKPHPSTTYLHEDVPPPPPPLAWTERVWRLLVSEIDHGTRPVQSQSLSSKAEQVETNHVSLAHLADEVLVAIKRAKGVMSSRAEGREEVPTAVDEKAAEASLRRRVESMVRTEDPVYRLLAQRLHSFLLQALQQRPLDGGGGREPPKGFHLPPLPQEIERVCRLLGDVVEWAEESWSIPR